jgi:hypothetical protein
MFAVNGREDRIGPSFGADNGRRQVVASEPPGVEAFEWVNIDLSPHGATEEQQ